MAIDDPGHDVFSGCVDYAGVPRVQVFPDSDNFSIAYQDISILQCAARYGEHGRVANEYVRRCAALRKRFRQ